MNSIERINPYRIIFGFYVFVVILFTIYQDSPGVLVLGEIGRTPVFFLSPLFLWFWLNNYRFQGGSTHREIMSFLRKFAISALIISVINVLIFYYENDNFYFLEEHVLIKSLKYILYYFTFFLIYKSVYLLLFKLNNSDTLVGFILIGICALLLLVNIIEIIEIPYALPDIHNVKMYWRVRLLASESSWTSGIVTVIMVIIMAYYRSWYSIMVAVAFIGVYVFTTSSKLFLTSTMIALFGMAIYKGRVNIFSLVLLLTVAIVIGIMVFPILQAAFLGDLQEFTSTITRSSNFISSLKLSITRPFGSGGLYYYYLLNDLKETSKFLVSDIFGQGDISEIAALGSSELGDKNISAGSSFAEWVAVFGLLGYVYFYRFIKIILSMLDENVFIIFGIFSFIVHISFSVSLMTRWEWALLLAFMSYHKDKKELYKSV